MEPVSNVDKLVLLLRQRLLDRSRQAAVARGDRSARAGLPVNSPSGVQALASVEGIDDRQLKRAVIQSFLAEQFGPHLINDARFQQVVDRVTGTIEADASSSRLLAGAVQALRASAG